MWLNNCIGSENYASFRRLIFWFLIFNLLSLALVGTAAAFGLLSFESSKIAKAFKIVIFVQASLSVVVILFDLQLILFHVWLVSKGITTYEYIHYKRERTEKKQKVKRGEMSREEYLAWDKTALIDPERPKSKTIVKLDEKAVK